MENERIEKAVELFKEGFNCSQAVVGAFADKYGFTREQALKMSASFGGGIGRMRETCGAACGLFMLAGLETGSTDGADRDGKAFPSRSAPSVLPVSKPASMKSPQAAPQVSRIRPIPPPKDADIFKACSRVKPYLSAKAPTTACEQLKPSLNNSTAFSILSFSIISLRY